MKDVNYSLRKAYIAALDGNVVVDAVNVPVYYMSAPEDETAKAYITLNQVSNNDAGSFSSSRTKTSMQVQIHTWDNNSNAGKKADDVSGAVLAIIYPTPQSVLDMSADNLQMIGTFLEGDNVSELTGHGNRVFITRILTFSHPILHK